MQHSANQVTGVDMKRNTGAEQVKQRDIRVTKSNNDKSNKKQAYLAPSQTPTIEFFFTKIVNDLSRFGKGPSQMFDLVLNTFKNWFKTGFLYIMDTANILIKCAPQLK